MNNFKQYKFNSDKPYEIILAVEVFKKLGYTVQDRNLDILQAIEYSGICTWDDGEITEGYLEYNTHEDITLEELKEIVCEASSLSVMTERCNSFTVSWEQVFGEKFVDSVSKAVKLNRENTDALCYQYKHLIGVQFNKNIYSFRECSPRYVHNIIRDKDGDVCVVDQYGVDYKLRDVEFYVSDEHDNTMPYQQYSKFVSI